MKIKTLFYLSLFFLFFTSCRQANEQLLHQAFVSSQQKKYAEAIDLYTQAIDKDGEIQLSYYNRGICYADIKEYAKALADFDTVMSLQTNGNFVITNAKDIPHANKQDVSFDEALYQRAQVYFSLDSVQNASHDFQLLIDDNFSKKCECLLWQGALWLKAGERDKACEYFNKAKQFAVSAPNNQAVDTMLATYCISPANMLPADSSKK